MQAENVAHYVGVVLGAFIFVTIVSRVIWYFATKLAGERCGMIAAFCSILLILTLRLTSSTWRLDVVYEIALAAAMLMYLFLDWRIVLSHERKK